MHSGLHLQDNTLDFLEYVAALHLILRGNLEDRLKWSFKMYDKDGNGKLDRHEVKRLIKVRPSMADTANRIHIASFYSRAAILDCLYLPNRLSASRCYVIPVGLRFYFRSRTDPLFSKFSSLTLLFLALIVKSYVMSIKVRHTLVYMVT